MKRLVIDKHRNISEKALTGACGPSGLHADPVCQSPRSNMAARIFDTSIVCDPLVSACCCHL